MLVSDDLILKQVLAKFGNMIMVFILHSVPKEHCKIPPFLRWKNLLIVSAEFLYQMMRLRPPLSLLLSIPYFESFESTPLSFVPPEVLDTSLLPEFPLPLNRFGITYERRFGPHASALAPSVSTPAPAPPVSAHLPIAIHKSKCSTLNDHLIYNCLTIVCLPPILLLFLLFHLSLSQRLFRKLSHPERRQAILDEMSALDSNRTWELSHPDVCKLKVFVWLETITSGRVGGI